MKDVYSGRIVGYSMDYRMKSSLAVAALESAVRARRPAGTVVHSDRGSQFRSRRFVESLRHHGLTGSMGRVGACADNAAMESFFSLLQKNVLDRQRWLTRQDLRLAITTWIERSYHRRRRCPGGSSSDGSSRVGSMADVVTVGGASCSFDEARGYVYPYLNDHHSDAPEARIWSYPAYDCYQGSSAGEVGDADLPAIALLNAGRRPLPSYYGLQKLLPKINERFSHPELKGSLEQAEEETLDAVVDLYNVVNEAPTPYVKLTTVTKVLHRKCPRLLPLFDQNIRRCYVYRGDQPPLAGYRTSESRDFIAAWVAHVRRDLVEGADQWAELASLAPESKPITSLRALDIVGWKLGMRLGPARPHPAPEEAS